MKKVYLVRLSEEERATCLAIVKKLKGTFTKVRCAHVLFKADANGPNWKDQDIAATFLCTRQCVENLWKRLVTEGFEVALHGIWLNIAENELSALTMQCVKGRRFGTMEELREEVMAWAQECNAKQKGVKWQFTTTEARIKLESLYPKFLY